MRLVQKLRDWVRVAFGRDAMKRLISQKMQLDRLEVSLDRLAAAQHALAAAQSMALNDRRLERIEATVDHMVGVVDAGLTLHDLRVVAERQASWDSALYLADNMLSSARAFTELGEFLNYCVTQAGIQPIYLEFGVFSGRSINMIADAAGIDARVVGFDSFEGLPERWRDGFDAGTFQVDSLPQVRPNVELVKGWFDKTLPLFVRDLRTKVGFVHVDCDLYSSTRTIFDHLAPHLADEVIVVFDEYFNYPGWKQHEFKAFQEFVAKSAYTYEYIAYVPVHQQVAVRLSRQLP